MVNRNANGVRDVVQAAERCELNAARWACGQTCSTAKSVKLVWFPPPRFVTVRQLVLPLTVASHQQPDSGASVAMWNSGIKLLIAISLCLAIGFSWGCMGSSAYRLCYRNQWLEDEKIRPSLYTRLEELTELQQQADGMSEAEQTRVAANLARALAEDPSPLYRAQVARTLGALPVPAATDALRQAVHDKEPSVRIAACTAWGKRGSEEAVPVLAEVLSKDADLDVRTAATRELANYKTPGVIPALGLALDDPNPALQHRAVLSLKDVTGKDFGNSVPAWRQFVRGGPVQPDEGPSLAERMRNLF